MNQIETAVFLLQFFIFKAFISFHMITQSVFIEITL